MFLDIDGNKSDIKEAIAVTKDVTTTIKTTTTQKEEEERNTDIKKEFKHSKVNEMKSIAAETTTESLTIDVEEEIELDEVTTEYTTKVGYLTT